LANSLANASIASSFMVNTCVAPNSVEG